MQIFNTTVFTSRLRTLSKEIACNSIAFRSYFNSLANRNKNIHWLFILTFPNGGSTALAKILLTSAKTTALTDNAEGQWLIPALVRARWDNRHRVSKRQIRAVWLSRLRKYKSDNVLVIEKSPPNLCRYDEILDAFKGMQTYLVTFTRDPYATCASWHKRYGTKVIRDWNPDTYHYINNEEDYFRMLGDVWIKRANMLLTARKHSIMNIRYENFTEDTAGTMKKLGALIPQIEDVSASATIRVKDYKAQNIVNMNDRQIADLSREQMGYLSSSLRRSRSVVEELGYVIR